MKKPLEIKIKYHDDALERVVQTSKGDWIDLRAANDMELKAGEYNIISLGVSMQLPEGYEAQLAPRSSTFRKWAVLQTNCPGIIDNSYSGDNDIWGMSVIALMDTTIKKNDRICQFRLVEKMPPVNFVEVETLGNPDRGGFGSTGTN